jgi:hypothetical protein
VLAELADPQAATRAGKRERLSLAHVGRTHHRAHQVQGLAQVFDLDRQVLVKVADDRGVAYGLFKAMKCLCIDAVAKASDHAASPGCAFSPPQVKVIASPTKLAALTIASPRTI